MAESLATALTPLVGRPEAMRLTSAISSSARCESRSHCEEAARGDAQVSSSITPTDLARVFDAVVVPRQHRRIHRARAALVAADATGETPNDPRRRRRHGDRVPCRRPGRCAPWSCSATRSARTTDCGMRRCRRSGTTSEWFDTRRAGTASPIRRAAPVTIERLAQDLIALMDHLDDRSRGDLRLLARRCDRVMAVGESSGACDRRGAREHRSEGRYRRELGRADRGGSRRRHGRDPRSGRPAVSDAGVPNARSGHRGAHRGDDRCDEPRWVHRRLRGASQCRLRERQRRRFECRR